MHVCVHACMLVCVCIDYIYDLYFQYNTPTGIYFHISSFLTGLPKHSKLGPRMSSLPL